MRSVDRARFAASACLMALLVQLLLPIVHTPFPLFEGPTQLIKAETTVSAFGLTSPTGKDSNHPGHDPASCSICQQLLRASAFLNPHDSVESSPLAAVGILDWDYSDSNISKYILISCGPRAPPHLS